MHLTTLADVKDKLNSANWPERITACKSVKDAAGIRIEKNQLAFQTATLEVA